MGGIFSGPAEQTVWDLADGEVARALDALLADRRHHPRRVFDIDRHASRMATWDTALHSEFMVSKTFPKSQRIILYFPAIKTANKRILRIRGLSSVDKLQREIHARLQDSTEDPCRLMVYLNDAGCLFRCIHFGLHVQLHWADRLGTSLGSANAEVTMRPPCPLLSEQDGHSNTQGAYLLTAMTVGSDSGGVIRVKKDDRVKWPVGMRMVTNSRPQKIVGRQPKTETAAQAAYDIDSMGQRRAAQLTSALDAFESSSGEDAEEDDRGDIGFTDNGEFSDGVFEEGGATLLEDGSGDGVATLPHLITVDQTGATRRPLQVKMLQLQDADGQPAVIYEDMEMAHISGQKEQPVATDSEEDLFDTSDT